VYDTVEWASKQPWCTGSVAMAGNSWLAVSQVNAAARCPHPALKAIAPWEAGSDAYNDLLARGGIPRGEFMRYLVRTMKGKEKIREYSLCIF
jgi:putative CocE/NonD family hydrolase